MIVNGLVKKDDYKDVTKSGIFADLENYSGRFTELQTELFPEFSKKWVKDSFHQWSRQYEYPFVADSIEKHTLKSGKVLDAGSGITFFPFYLEHKYPEINIECCDYDPILAVQFDRVNSRFKKNVKYFDSDIRKIGRPDGYYDTVYCISVLEHTGDYEAVVREFSRLLSDQGKLILTFDISVDGSADIPFHKAVELLGIVEKYFEQIPGSVSVSAVELKSPEILTTNFIWDQDRNLIPWKYPRLMFLKSLSKGKLPKYLIRNLACYCGVFKKREVK
jgi:SAM-dependent methyltransferase